MVPMKNPHVIWGSVAIVALLVVGSVILAALGRDVTVVLTLAAIVAVPVLGALGVGIHQKFDQMNDNVAAKLDTVKEQVNGNTAQQMEMIRALQETVKNLALRVPPPTESTPEEMIALRADATMALPKIDGRWES